MQVSDKVLTAIGIMSGTSLDGVDLALLRTDGLDVIEGGPTLFQEYPRETKVLVRRAITAALEGRDGANEIAKAEDAVTSTYIDGVRRFLETHRLTRKDIDVIGLHGQTILHRAPADRVSVGRSWQIGAGAILAEEVRIDVVNDFRGADIAAGGEGAPLAPVYHAALIRKAQPAGAVCVLNIGGVANITWVPADGDPARMVAFDCGPGNGLVDEWVHLKTGEAMDRDGVLAATGKVHEETVRLMALNPYLRRQPPKSLDRYDFKIAPVGEMSVEDGAATLTAFTAEAVARSVPLLPEPPEGWVVVGGGRHNPVLMSALRARLDQPVEPAETFDWRGDDLEAECFAYLAVRSLKKLPISFPGTTRVPHPLTGGTYSRAPV